jgi:aldehyde dehydrogenase (NAD+)
MGQPTDGRDFEVTNPATEAPIATISMGSAIDVDKAVAAAKQAFPSYSELSIDARLAFIRRIVEVYQDKSRRDG